MENKQPVVGSISKVRFSIKKLGLLAMVLLLAAVLVAGVYFLGIRSNQAVNERACTDDLVRQQVADKDDIFEPKKMKTLEQVVNVLKAKEYEKNAACLYVVTVYDLNAGNNTEGRKHFDMLIAFENPYGAYYPVIGMKAKSIETLEDQLKFTEEQFEQAIKNGQMLQSQ